MPKTTKRRRPPALDCPTCGAKAGRPCVAASGAEKPDVHVARLPPKPAPTPREADIARAPRYTRWAAAQPSALVFDAPARARFIEAMAAHGRLGLAVAVARVSQSSVTRWRKAGEAQLREVEKHQQRQDRLPLDQRAPYLGPRDAADFVLQLEGARGWWEAQHQSRLQQAAEAETRETGLANTMYLLNRHDRLVGAVKGEVHDHHHHPAPSAVVKLGETIKRRQALRGGGE